MATETEAVGEVRARMAPPEGCFAMCGMSGDATPGGSVGRRRRGVLQDDPAICRSDCAIVRTNK